MSYNRYHQLTNEGTVGFPPTLKYQSSSSDKEYLWKSNLSRMDLVSHQFYSDPNFDWLILWANPILPKLEFEIPDHTFLTIPFPLEDALNQYKQGIERYKQLYYID